MQVLKKIVSLLLVAAMISSLALVAFAAEASGADEKVGLKLCAFDSKGQELAAGTELAAGDTIKVQVKVTKAVTVNNLDFFVRYDKEVLESKTDGYLNEDDDYIWKTGTLATAKVDLKAAYNILSSKRDDGELKTGESAWRIMFTKDKSPVSFSADDVLWEMNFTAKSAATATQLEVLLNTAQRLNKREDGSWDITPVNIDSEFTTENLTLAVKAAPVAVENIALNKSTLTIAKNGSAQLTATIKPDDATDKTITWDSSEKTVATVDENGLVTAVSPGETTITATAGEKSASCVVTVSSEEDLISAFEMVGDADQVINLNTDENLFGVRVTMKDANAPVPKVVWTSDDPDVADIASTTTMNEYRRAYVAAKKLGTAHITATAGTHSVTFNVTVEIMVTKVTISCADTDLTKVVLAGRPLQLTATLTPENTTQRDVVWKSSDEKIATVDQTGKVTLLATGTVRISAKAGNKTASKKLTVVNLGQSDYQVTMPDDQTTSVGEVVTLPVTVSHKDASVTAFNAFNLNLIYDTTALELVTKTLDDGDLFDTNGKIHIVRYGDTRKLGTLVTLQFKVLAAAGADGAAPQVRLDSAQVDISDHALSNNAPDAQIINPGTVLTVKHFVELPEDMTSNQGNYIANGEDYTFKLDKVESFYDYDVSATMDGQPVEVVDNGDGSYTVKNVTGALKITLVKNAKTYSVTFKGDTDDVTENETTATYGKDYTFKLNRDEKFQYTFETKIGGVDYAVTGPDAEGNYKILGTAIKGDIEITVTKTELPTEVYGVTVTGSGKGDVKAPEKATKGGDFTFTVVEEDGYFYTVEITINGLSYTKATVVESEDGMTKTYTILGADVTGPIIITVSKDEAFNVTFENADPNVIRIYKTDAKTKITDGKDLAKKGSSYVFMVKDFFLVYDLHIEVTENGVTKDYTDEVAKGSGTRRNHTITIENVQGDLDIKLSWVASDSLVKVVVTPYVELNNKTIYLVATRTSAECTDRSIMLDTYDGNGMYRINGLYADRIPGSSTNTNFMTCLWLVTVDKGETFTKDDALKHLSFTNFLNISQPDTHNITDTDVNVSGYLDVNDAQLVYDIYSGKYPEFCMTNKLKGQYVEQQTGVTMTKYLRADVNRDMKVDIHDAAAIVNLIK